VSIAGCTINVNNATTQSSAPSANVSPSVSISIKMIAPTDLPLSKVDLSPFFSRYIQTERYTIVTPFKKGVSSSTGNDQHKGAVADGIYIFGTSIKATASPDQTATMFDATKVIRNKMASQLLSQQQFMN
jgi:hypothetical protein